MNQSGKVYIIDLTRSLTIHKEGIKMADDEIKCDIIISHFNVTAGAQALWVVKEYGP